MAESAEIAEETAVTPDIVPLPSAAPWQPATWGPMVLLAAHGVFALFFNPLHTNGPDHQELMGLLLGVHFSQPMMCAWWSAWSTAPLVWRAPTGIAANVFLLLMASLEGWDPMLGLLYAVMGFVFWALFALLRWRTRWRLATAATADPGQDTPAETQFGIRFLIGWTTIVAVMCALAKAVTFSSGRMPPSGLQALMFMAVYVLLVVPAPTAIQLILAGGVNGRKSFFVALVAAACVLGSATLATSLQPAPSFGDVVQLFSWFSVGAIAGGAASAVALRGSGYRMVHAGH